MSRTLSRGKVGPGPDILGQALSLSQPSCGDLGVSLRRSSLQFNIRPWRTSALGNPLLRLGLPRSKRQSRARGWRLAALAKKRDWGSPQRPRISAEGWDGSRYAGAAFPKASRSRPCGLSPSTSMRARGRSRRWPCSCGRRARASRARLLDEPSHALGGMAPRRRGPATWPLARSFECGEHPR